MTDRSYRFVGGEACLRDPNEIGIVSKVLRRPAAGQDQRNVVFGFDITKGDIGLEMISPQVS